MDLNHMEKYRKARIQIILKTLCCIFILGLSYTVAAKEFHFSFGGDYDPELYQSVSKMPPLARGSDSDLPSAYSLKYYAPQVGNQGRSGSCVGWSVGYAARTILYNKWADSSTPKQPTIGAFSPSWVFNQIKLSSDCNGGSYISEALQLIATKGALSDKFFPYSDVSCSRSPSANEELIANQFRIEHYRRLSSSNTSSSLVSNTRKALARGHPVAIGMLVGKAFMAHRGNDTVAFTPSDYNERTSGLLNGHALTVVGYDDSFQGGAFEVLNSWGDNWGNKGYFWINYKDYLFFVAEAHEVIGPEPYVEPQPKPVANFYLQPSFKHFDGHWLALKSEHQGYRIEQPLGTGERFRAELKANQNSYIYVVGADRDTNKQVVLFPHKAIASPFIGEGETLLLPGPSEDYFSQLNQTEGEDYFVILASATPVDIEKVVSALNALRREKDIHKRLSAVLGDRLVFPQIEPAKAFTYLEKEHVMATVVVIEHVATANRLKETDAPKIVFTHPEPEVLATSQMPAKIFTELDKLIILGTAQDQSRIKEITSEDALQVRFSSRGPFKLEFNLQDLKEGEVKQITVKAMDEYGNTTTNDLIIEKQKKDRKDRK